jgi:hypothetical protein
VFEFASNPICQAARGGGRVHLQAFKNVHGAQQNRPRGQVFIRHPF